MALLTEYVGSTQLPPGQSTRPGLRMNVKMILNNFGRKRRRQYATLVLTPTVLFYVYFTILKTMLITSGLKDCSSQTRALRIGGEEYLVSCKREF